MIELPLFPLPVVLFPGAELPLQIFEPRYLRMVKEVMKSSGGFVIVQSMPTAEHAATRDGFCTVGCYAEIKDWTPLPDNLLGIDVEGINKVRIHSHREESDKLLVGACEHLPEEVHFPVPEKHQSLVQLLQDLNKHPAIQDLGFAVDYNDASDVGKRLAEFLPFEAAEKQLLLETDDALIRLETIHSLIRQIGVR